MFGTKRLLFIVGLAFKTTALPAVDPNDECSSSWNAYESSSREYEQPYSTSYIATTVIWSRSTVFDQPLTTLCDGRPRAVGPYTTYEYTSTITLDPPEPTYWWSAYPSDPPTCTTAGSLPNAAVETSDPDSDLSPRAAYVPCTDASPGYCFIYADYDPKVYYWPVTTVSGDFCAQNGSTVFAEPTSPPEPNTAVIDGYTFTSPTNYISFGNVRAVIHGRRPSTTRCGVPNKTKVILPITETFYSGAYLASETYSFNFADLNTVPVEAYNRQRKCGYQHNLCDDDVILDEADYTPILPLPTEIMNLEPEEWKAAGCGGSVNKYYFTPVALATPAPTAVKKLLL
jgi:hypothetical protein